MAVVKWNPSDKNGSITLSNGDLTATAAAGGAHQLVRADTFKTAGRWYCEVTTDSATGAQLGITTSALGYSSLMGWNSYSAGEHANGQFFYPPGLIGGFGLTFSNGDVIGILMDMDNRKLSYWKGGTSYTDVWTIPAGDYTIGFEGDSSAAVTANFGQRAFSNTLPAGYSPWTTGSDGSSAGSSTASAESVTVLLGVGTAGGSSTAAAVGYLGQVTQPLTPTLPSLAAAVTGKIGALATVSATLPVLRSGISGGQYTFSATLPALTASITGEPAAVATIKATLPSLEAAMTGVAAVTATITLTAPRLTADLQAKLGNVGVLQASLPRLIVAMESLTGTVGSLDLVLPRMSFDALGMQQITGTMSLRLPRLAAALTAKQANAQILTHVVNTITNAVVMYENYPFNSFARFNNMYLAAGPGGLYSVDVGSDDSGTAIDASLSTGEIMFGSEFIKRISDFYAGMRSAGDITITVVADEQETFEYTLTPLDIAQLKQRRTWFGKGLRGKYFQFKFRNNNGADFDFDTMNVAAVATSRRL